MKLQAEVRSVIGKKLNVLRQSGLTPANLYGKDLPSIALQVPTRSLDHALQTAGRNAIITLEVAGSGKPAEYDVVVRDTQRYHGMGDVIHVDFYRVSTTEAMTAEVAVVLVGETAGMGAHTAHVAPGQATLHIAGVASKIPSSIEADISGLQETGSLRAGDLVLPAGLTLVSDPDVVLATLVAMRGGTPEAEAPAPATAPATTRP